MQRNRNIRWIKTRPIEREKVKDLAFAEKIATKHLKIKEDLLAGMEDAAAEAVSNTFLLSFDELAEKVGLPSVPDTTPEEEIKELLLTAAEVEHGLMAMYIYAGNSCTDAMMGGIVKGIAVEEMGHLITVQNLLQAIGSTPYLGRYDKSPQDLDPFPFALEPISRFSIAKYAACEMPEPANIDHEDLDVLPNILADALVSSGNMEPHRIGLLYMKIYWLLRETDDELADPTLEPWTDFPIDRFRQEFPGRHIPFAGNIPLTAQAKKSPWQSGIPDVIVRTISKRDDALKAIAAISAQGEGFANENNSHFDRFVEAYRTAMPGGEICLDVAKDPWYHIDGLSDGDPVSEITSQLAMGFALLGDLLYEILLLSITLAVHPATGETEPNRKKIGRFCIDLMMVGLRPMVIAMPQITIKDDPASPKLLLCFRLPDFPDDPVATHAQLLNVLGSTIELASNLKDGTGNADLAGAAGDIKTFIEEGQIIFQP
jgi:hypothetical protein